MRVVLDTNVFISAVFFGGVPGKIMDMWREGDIELLLSAEILAEYEDVARRLGARYSDVDPDPVIRLVVQRGMFVNPRPLEQAVCADPDDDKFLAAALAAATGLVVSGDKHLLAVSGYCRLRILTPAEFLEKYGSEASREE